MPSSLQSLAFQCSWRAPVHDRAWFWTLWDPQALMSDCVQAVLCFLTQHPTKTRIPVYSAVIRIKAFPVNLSKGLENSCWTRVECWKMIFFLLLVLILLDKTKPATGFIDHPPSCSKLSAWQSDNGDGLACKWKSFNDTEKNNENRCLQIIYTAIEAFFFFFYELNSQEICESCLLGQRLVLYPLNHSSLLD